MNQTFSSQYDLLSRFFRMASISALSSLMVPLATTLSVIFLGHLSEINHLAGVALAGNLINTLYLLLSFLRMGTTGVTAMAVGRDDREAVLLVGLRNGIIALGLGIAIIILQFPLRELGFALLNAAPEVKISGISYFNAQVWGAPAVLLNFVLIGWFLGREQNSVVLLLSFVSNAVNIALDYLFIVQWNWESTGAGMSQAISQYLAVLVGLIFFCKEIQWQEFRAIAGKIWNLSAFKSIFTLNGDIFLNNFFLLLAFVIFNYQASSLGTITYAENALLLQVLGLCTYFVEGIGFTTETLVGNSKGKGSFDQLLPIVSIGVGTSLLVGLSFAGVCLLFPSSVFGLLTNHTEVTENIDFYLPWLLLILIFTSICFSLEGYFIGLGHAYTARNVTLAAIAVAFVPADIVALQFHSNHLLWLTVCLFMLTRMLGFAVKLPSTFGSDLEDSSASLMAHELFEEESLKQVSQD
jgi:multidrug resistance protein, MATE family